MMFDMELLIQHVLTRNEKIVEYVSKTKQGYPNIGANRTPHGTFPLIEYHQIYGSDVMFGDNDLITRKYSYQIGIYSMNDDYYKIQNEVDKAMRELGFTCYNDYTYAVDDSKVIHRIFSYTIELNDEMYEQLLQKYNLQESE